MAQLNLIWAQEKLTSILELKNVYPFSFCLQVEAFFMTGLPCTLQETRCISLLHCCTWPGACRRKSGPRSRFEQEVTGGRLPMQCMHFFVQIGETHSSVLMQAQNPEGWNWKHLSQKILLFDPVEQWRQLPLLAPESLNHRVLAPDPLLLRNPICPPDKGCDSYIKGANGWFKEGEGWLDS